MGKIKWSEYLGKRFLLTLLSMGMVQRAMDAGKLTEWAYGGALSTLLGFYLAHRSIETLKGGQNGQ